MRDRDLFGIVSTGPSSIAIDVTGDGSLLDAATARITGDGFNPKELVEELPAGRSGSTGVDGTGPNGVRVQHRSEYTYDATGENPPPL